MSTMSCVYPRIPPRTPQYKFSYLSLLMTTCSSEHKQNRTGALFRYTLVKNIIWSVHSSLYKNINTECVSSCNIIKRPSFIHELIIGLGSWRIYSKCLNFWEKKKQYHFSFSFSVGTTSNNRLLISGNMLKIQTTCKQIFKRWMWQLLYFTTATRYLMEKWGRSTSDQALHLTKINLSVTGLPSINKY